MLRKGNFLFDAYPIATILYNLFNHCILNKAIIEFKALSYNEDIHNPFESPKACDGSFM